MAEITRARKFALDLTLKTVGAGVCYGLGLLVGEAMDHVPYLSQWIPQAVDYLSGIDIQNNLDGVMGLVGAVGGLKHSGTTTFEDDPGSLETICVAPIKLH